MGVNIVPSQDASVYSALTSAQQLALVRPSNPPPGLAGLLFDIDGDDVVKLRSLISQHFAEDNTTFQDQIALPPITVTLRRYVGELVFTSPVVPPVSAVPDALPNNDALSPVLTPGAVQMQAQLTPDVSVTQDANDLWEFYLFGAGQRPNQTRQSIVFGYILQLWLARTLFTVETPYGVFTNMAIEMCDFEQPEESTSSSHVNLTFQQVRIIQPATVTVGQVAGRAADQQAPVTQSGTAGTSIVTPAQQSSILQQILYPPAS